MNQQNNKLFSLIYGEEVRKAPRTKVIPAEEFSVLQTADEVLSKVESDIQKYRMEIVAETEKLKEQAQKEGFEAGYTEWVEKIAKLEEEIAVVRKDMEQKVLPVAIQAAKKIVNREIELSNSAILDIVTGTLKAVSQHKKVTIYINQDDLNVIEANRSQLKQLFENLESMSIRARSDVKPGGCVIETEVGIINAQLENRWRILEAVFNKLTKAK